MIKIEESSKNMLLFIVNDIKKK